MKEIIEEANKKRFKLDKEDENKEGILITENWVKELTKHPYYSSKIIAPHIYLEKPGAGIFLMRERAKLYKWTGERKKHSLSKRLSDQAPLQRHEEEKSQAADKRMKGNDGKPIMAGAIQNQD